MKVSMALTPPKSMQECIYFTNRSSGAGSIKAWVYRKPCPKCKKATMGKPVDKGKVKIRATEYVCPSCGFTEDKKAHEESLTLEAKFTCPSCKKEGEGTTQYKRKSFQGVPSYVVSCPHCAAKIPITKKLKDPKGPKKKGAAAEEDMDDDD